MIKAFICGSSGTTGLRLRERLLMRSDTEVIDIEYEKRRDIDEVKACIDASNVTFLCLPDDAAKKIAAVAGDKQIIDTSTAHRISENWAYGFPELSSNHRSKIETCSKVSVPGCHASGFISLVYPLKYAGVLPSDYPMACTSLTGYSGGGKVMISDYENEKCGLEFKRPRQYALGQLHKHLPEMTKVCKLDYEPVFNPIIENFYSGMLVSIPLHTRLLKGSVGIKDIWELMALHYKDSKLVNVMPLNNEGLINAAGMSGRDSMEIYVTGNDDRITLISRFDNLGKGASGAAIQCYNITIGAKETEGLVL